MTMQVECIPVLRDSMSYLLIDTISNEAAIIDAADINKIERIASERNANVVAVLSTSNKWDHARDNEEAKRRFPGITIYGSRLDETRAMDKAVKQGDSIHVGTLNVIVKEAHAFTEGSLMFVAKGPGDQPAAVFTGGTLLCGGAGCFTHHHHGTDVRIKKGNVERGGGAEAMYRVLNDVLGSLPDDTMIFPGYRGLAGNLKFAQQVEPDNEDIQQRIEELKGIDEIDLIPSTLGIERKTNPFLRLKSEAVRNFVGHEGRKQHFSPVKVLDILCTQFQESGFNPKMQTA